MVMLVTLDQAKEHVRLDHDASDDDLQLKIKAASRAVLRYLQVEASVYTDESGDPTLDSNGDSVVPEDVQGATLLLTGMLFKDRDGKDAAIWERGYLPAPVTAMLARLYSPSLA
jgi:hypothetical protein